MLRPLQVVALVLALSTAPLAAAQDHQHGVHPQGGSPPTRHDEHQRVADRRVGVRFPPLLKAHTLANMRDHLQSLSQIQAYLAAKDFDRAGELAEKRLGMSSLPLHGAHEVAPYMPKGMQDAGTAMHRAASQFAAVTQEAAIDRDVPRALAALNKVTESCVACHAGYRLD